MGIDPELVARSGDEGTALLMAVASYGQLNEKQKEELMRSIEKIMGSNPGLYLKLREKIFDCNISPAWNPPQATTRQLVDSIAWCRYNIKFIGAISGTKFPTGINLLFGAVADHFRDTQKKLEAELERRGEGDLVEDEETGRKGRKRSGVGRNRRSPSSPSPQRRR